MKRLVLRFSLYLLLLLFALIALVFGLSLIVRNCFGSQPKTNIHRVILGHSHSQCAYDDSKLNKTWNFSGSGESYLYTLAKVNYLLEKQPQVQEYYIEFSNNHINSGMQSKMWGDSYINTHYSWAYPHLGLNEHALIATNNPMGWIKSWSFNSKRSLEYIIERNWQNTEELGGYLALNKYKVDSLLKFGSPFEGYDWHDTIPCMANIQCLEKIIETIIQAGKKVTLIRSPLHSVYPGRINEKQYQRILRQHFAQITFLDYVNFPLTNREFGDLGHLNMEGATRFSMYCDSTWSTSQP
jgi:hypothetical protein